MTDNLDIVMDSLETRYSQITSKISGDIFIYGDARTDLKKSSEMISTIA